MKNEGLISAFGAGLNANMNGEDPEMKTKWNQWYVNKLLSMEKVTGEKGIDFFLAANLYSLLNYNLLDSGILDNCYKAGVKVIIGGPYSSGILATGADPANKSPGNYIYLPASKEILDRTRKIEVICRKHSVPLMAASLQFPLGHPAVESVIPGGKSPEETQINSLMMTINIPSNFWTELKDEGLLPKDAHTPSE